MTGFPLEAGHFKIGRYIGGGMNGGNRIRRHALYKVGDTGSHIDSIRFIDDLFRRLQRGNRHRHFECDILGNG